MNYDAYITWLHAIHLYIQALLIGVAAWDIISMPCALPAKGLGNEDLALQRGSQVEGVTDSS